MKNYYKVLGIQPSASHEEIKHAYKQLTAQYHPQKHSGSRYAEERFIDISVAYNTLINPNKRKDYDRILNSVLSIPEQRNLQKARLDPVVTVPQPEPVIATRVSPAGKKYWLAAGTSALLATAAALTFYLMPARTHNDHAVSESIPPVAATRQDPTPELNHAKPETPAATARKAHVAAHRASMSHRAEPVLAADLQVPRDHVSTQEDPSWYSIGSSRRDVLKVQGTPNAIVRYDQDYEEWRYGNSSVSFSKGVVTSFQNNNNNLQLKPAASN